MRLLLSITGLLGLMLTTTGCSQPDASVPDSANDVRPLLPGMPAPAFAAREPDGASYLFDPENLDHPVIITFYRGGWCPYCTRYLWAMRQVEPLLVDMGYDMLFLSADSPETLAASLEDKSEFAYTLLSDNDLEAAKAFGVAFRLDDELFAKYVANDHDLEGASGRKHHMLPVPATFIITQDGIIQFSYVNPNYKVRLHADVLIAAAETAIDRAD